MSLDPSIPLPLAYDEKERERKRESRRRRRRRQVAMSPREKSTLEACFDPDGGEREGKIGAGDVQSRQMKSLGIIRSERGRQEAIKTNRSCTGNAGEPIA